MYGVDKLHLHHYVIAQYILIFACFQTPLITWVNGYVTGMMIDGGAEFGWDPLFENPEDMWRNRKNASKKLQEAHEEKDLNSLHIIII